MTRGADRRVALVTGAAGDIGTAIARRLAADGLRLVLTDRRAPEALARELDAIATACDLAEAEHVRQLAASVLGTPGRCDILVNVAADLTTARLQDVELTAWRRVQAVNVEAPLLLCQALLPDMAQRGWGRVINIASDTVHRPPAPGLLPYVTSKAALIGLTRALAVEYGDRGVTVNALAPGLTATEAARRDVPAEAFADVREHQAIPRTLTPEDCAGPVAFLASDASGAMTGQTLSADAGLVML